MWYLASGRAMVRQRQGQGGAQVRLLVGQRLRQAGLSGQVRTQSVLPLLLLHDHLIFFFEC